MTREQEARGVVEAFVAERALRLPMTEEAFLDLYARTSGQLAGYLRRLTANHAIADDLLQETYLRLLNQASVPADEDHLRRYLFKMATNAARDHFRREQRRRNSVGPQGPTSTAPAEDGDRRRDVTAVLARVTPRDRELLLLAYVEGLTHQEISGVTGLMRASIKPLLFRARRRFVRALGAAGLGNSIAGSWR